MSRLKSCRISSKLSHSNVEYTNSRYSCADAWASTPNRHARILWLSLISVSTVYLPILLEDSRTWLHLEFGPLLLPPSWTATLTTYICTLKTQFPIVHFFEFLLCLYYLLGLSFSLRFPSALFHFYVLIARPRSVLIIVCSAAPPSISAFLSLPLLCILARFRGCGNSGVTSTIESGRLSRFVITSPGT